MLRVRPHRTKGEDATYPPSSCATIAAGSARACINCGADGSSRDSTNSGEPINRSSRRVNVFAMNTSSAVGGSRRQVAS